MTTIKINMTSLTNCGVHFCSESLEFLSQFEAMSSGIIFLSYLIENSY